MTSRHPVQLANVKRTYAKTAQSIGELLGQAGIAKRMPSRDDRLNHWIVSLTRVHDPLALAELGVPWWTYRAIDIVDAWLAAHMRPVRVFEYGSGASTIWLADRSAEVQSVEHDRAFGDFIGSVLVRRPEIHFRVVPPTPSSNPVVASSKEGNSGRDFTDYVSAIHDPGGAFDLIVIDGRAREACW